MELKTYQSIDDYLRDNLDFLEKQGAENNLIIGLSLGCQKERAGPLPVMASLFRQAKVVFCAYQRNHNLLLYGPLEFAGEAIQQLIPYFQEIKASFPGVVARKELATSFAKAWTTAESVIRWKVGFEQLIYRLDQVVDIRISPGSMRKVSPKDLPCIQEWSYELAKEAMQEDDREEAYQMAAKLVEGGTLYAWELDSHIVSMAGTSRPTQRGITLNYVYTPAIFRGKGYASSA